MKYKIVKKVELDSNTDLFINVSAQCMLDLLYKRLVDDNLPDFLKDDNLDIDYDFSLYDSKLLRLKREKGLSNDKYIDSADSFVRRL